ncbi:TITAN-like protein isoform X1 [Eutrema salsugineum]|uniref:TITAN-like protein isoform X1 n=1 Tax=Eutrema salsugineum TaxID=72664 RepID=UPI000CED7E37|nr:TITAN-like protein isoform X1 [Eutrema salsugineum]XP_024005812.1 TITAN-like protein isoform X1 [Eutrema salsugineum]XP_024005813.1 TITAN-like protein isoform X1 [Eutrema salsugineum]
MSMEETKKKKKKKSSTKSEFEFCKVCRLHHDQGPRHKYFPRHKDSLSAFLDRFRSKVADVRFFLKNPSVLRPQEESQNRVWCVFCDEDIVELGSSFACSKAINHFASPDHHKNIKQFLWKYGPAMDCIDDFLISEADVAKWGKKCKALRNKGSCGQLSGTSNDIHNKLEFETMDRIEKPSAQHINSNHPNDVMPLLYNTNEYQISNSEFPGVAHYGSHLNVNASHLPLYADPLRHLPGNEFGEHCIAFTGKDYSGNGNYCTQENYQMRQDKKQIEGSYSSPGVVGMSSISSSHSSDDSGNVHSGAPPPWLNVNDGNISSVELNQSEMTRFQEKRPVKTCKLNPNRVGAAWAERRKMEMEMEKRGQAMSSNTDADWLPNFGRVWQSGTRKESRKEFEKEKRKLVKTESISVESEPVQIQPYISKRARREKSSE